MNRKNKKVKKSAVKKYIAALLAMIMLCSVVYTSVAFASNISEETQSTTEEENSTQETEKQTEQSAAQETEKQSEKNGVQKTEQQSEETGTQETEQQSEETGTQETKKQLLKSSSGSVSLFASGDSNTYAAENYFDASGTSTNAHFNVKGIFVDSSNNAYLVLFLEKNPNLKEIVHIVVNGTQINHPNVDHWEKSITIDLPGESSKTLQSTYGILVIEAGSITNLQEQFLIDIKTVAGGWDITGLKVLVDIDYSIQKTVNPKTANIGDKLTYTITVSNDGAIALNGVDVTDTVPEGLRILSVNCSQVLNWKTEGKVLYLDKNVTLGVSASKTYTVEAEVSGSAAPGKLTNTAEIGGSVIPKEATADVEINKSHVVTVKKIVTGNLGDQNKKFAFTATVKNTDGKVRNISFSLKNGEAESITEVPDGATVTVIETEANENGYATSYAWSVDSDSWSKGNVKVIDQDTTFKVTNNKNGTINTGVELDSLPYILILTTVFAGCGVFAIRRHRRLV